MTYKVLICIRINNDTSCEVIFARHRPRGGAAVLRRGPWGIAQLNLAPLRATNWKNIQLHLGNIELYQGKLECRCRTDDVGS